MVVESCLGLSSAAIKAADRGNNFRAFAVGPAGTSVVAWYRVYIVAISMAGLAHDEGR